MRRKRAAAGLSRGDDHLAAVRREHANRGVMQRGKTDLGDAPGKQRHAGAARAHGRIRAAELREKKFAVDRRQQPLAVRKPEQAENSGCARERLQSRALVKVEDARDDRDAARIGQQAAKHKIPRKARKKWPPVILLDLRARRFDQFAVLDAGRARGLARAAIQALVDVLHEGFAEREPALIHQHHLADSAARRIGFEAPEFVRRALIQTQAAMNAARIVVV